MFGYIWFLAGCLVSYLPQFLASSLAPNSMALCLLWFHDLLLAPSQVLKVCCFVWNRDYRNVSLVRGSYLWFQGEAGFCALVVIHAWSCDDVKFFVTYSGRILQCIGTLQWELISDSQWSDTPCYFTLHFSQLFWGRKLYHRVGRLNMIVGIAWTRNICMAIQTRAQKRLAYNPLHVQE